jgi:hypothetical protein
MIRIQLTSKEILIQVFIVKIKKKEEFDEKKTLQTIINEDMKNELKKDVNE